MTSTSSLVCALAALLIAAPAQGGVVPVAAPYAVAPFASSYNTHTIHHNIATPVAAPVVAAPYVAAPAVAAPYVAAPAVAAAAPYVASPYIAPAAYPYAYPLLK